MHATLNYSVLETTDRMSIIQLDRGLFFFCYQLIGRIGAFYSVFQSIKFIISVAHCRLDFTINSSIQI